MPFCKQVAPETPAPTFQLTLGLTSRRLGWQSSLSVTPSSTSFPLFSPLLPAGILCLATVNACKCHCSSVPIAAAPMLVSLLMGHDVCWCRMVVDSDSRDLGLVLVVDAVSSVQVFLFLVVDAICKSSSSLWTPRPSALCA